MLPLRSYPRSSLLGVSAGRRVVVLVSLPQEEGRIRIPPACTNLLSTCTIADESLTLLFVLLFVFELFVLS